MRITKMSSNKNLLHYLRYIVHLKKVFESSNLHSSCQFAIYFLFTLFRGISCLSKFGKIKPKIQLNSRSTLKLNSILEVVLVDDLE